MDPAMTNAIEIIKDKLYMGFHDEDYPPAKTSPQYTLFLNDKSLVFTSFFADFGPLDLGLTHKFCSQLHDTITKSSDKNKPVLYSCSSHAHHRSNGAVLVCAYMIFVHNCTAERAYGPFMGISPPFITFRDAGFCINTFPLTVLDCARAMRRACSLGHFNYRAFNPTAFHNLAKLQNGDLSWIVPGKFLAFSGPIAKRRVLSPGVYSLTPEGYIPVLKKLDVSCIVRFNSKCYDRNVFIVNGIRHVDLYYEDGGNPTEEILQAFLQLCENERGAIAVHCKAGLGRTGTNIAAYMIKHYGYTAKETMAWCRLCRPGSIVGPQQQYLESIEGRMLQEGADYRLKHRLPHPMSADEKSVLSASNSVDGQLSAYTGVSVTGPGSISGLSTSGGGGNIGTSTSHGALSSYSDGRVSTPPLLGNNSYANRPKQTTESLFRNAVGASKPSAAEAAMRDAQIGNSVGVAVAKMSHLQIGAGVNTNDLDMRRPATSGGVVSRHGHGNTSPLRGGGAGGEMHSTSFNYGHPENQNLNTSNVRKAALQGQSPGGSQSFSGQLAHHQGHQGHHHAASPDHEGGPGKRQSGAYSAAESALRPGSSHGGGAYGSAQLGSPDRRSASTSRGYQQQAGTNYTLASPSSGERVAFYDEGRQVAGAGAGAGAAYRGGTTQNGTDRMRLSAELGPRPGTSGGLHVSGSGSPSAAYQGGRQGSPALSPGSGAYAGRLPKQDYPSYESYASAGQQQQSALGGGTMTVSRPRTSGGALSSSGGTSQGRSHSNGRSGLYKRRF